MPVAYELAGRGCRQSASSQALADNRFTDCFRIGSIGFTALHERLHVGWRYQAHIVPALGDLASPIMCPTAGFHPDQAR